VGGVESFRDISDIKNLSNHLEERYGFENIIGYSKSMQTIYDLLENVAQTDTTVLITGESGTGKELVARALHLNSDRKAKPFVTVNCSAFVENLLESELFGHEKGAFTGAIRTKQGRFEMTQGGSLFLDEIGDITPHVQVKLLRVLETRHFERVGGTQPIRIDGRIMAATNKDLQKEIREKRFREDLFYRINVVNIHLPPLRERMDDLPLLVQHFMDKFRTKFNKEIDNISSAAFKILKEYHWPGNIRELENVIEHTFVLCNRDTIDVGCLPEWLLTGRDSGNKLKHPEPPRDSIREAEKYHIQCILQKFNGHRGQTAKALGINKSTLWRKMKKYDLLT
jgi:transcriptional regulator with PAS, ATPase and Fis domain